MDAILSLRPNVTLEQAERLLRPVSALGLLRRFSMGRLRAIAEVYLPFHLHEVKIANRGQTQKLFFALDAVSGTLDLYRLEAAPSAGEMLTVKTRNRIEPELDEKRGQEIVANRVRRLLFRNGFYRLKDVNIAAAEKPLEVHIPYWIGFYGDGEMNIVVVDAVRRRIEGPKISKLIRRWLTTQN